MVPSGGIRDTEKCTSTTRGKTLMGHSLKETRSFPEEEKQRVLNEAGMSHDVNWREELWIGF